MSDAQASSNEGAPVEVEPVTPAPEPQTQVIRRQPKALSQRDPVSIAKHFFASGFFEDVKSMSQAVVKIIAGEEIGIGPMAAIKGITVIEGDLGYSGNLVATLIKRHPVYDYRIKERTNERCEIEFGPAPAPGRDESGEWLPWLDAYGTSEFTVEDAKRAELIKPRGNWMKWPRAMCFNRALTEGVRAHIPDVTAGTPAYTDDEIEEVVETSPVAEQGEAETSAPALPPERIQELADLIRSAEKQLDSEGVNWLDGLNVLLGSLGIDGFSPNESLVDELTKLTPEQSYALEAELRKLVDASTEGGDDAD